MESFAFLQTSPAQQIQSLLSFAFLISRYEHHKVVFYRIFHLKRKQVFILRQNLRTGSNNITIVPH